MSFSGSIVVFSCAPELRVVALIIAVNTESSPVTMPAHIDERYSRQVLFTGIGQAGQERLRSSCIAIVGGGATGSAPASLRARSGVGKLIIIDRDYVEFSNLQRQSLFDEKDAAESLPKALAAS